MKKLIFLALLACTSLSFAGDVIESSKEAQVEYFDLVVDVHRTYSQTAGMDAKVIEILAGDGVNPIRMFLALRTDAQDVKVFELGIMMYSVRRITFLAKDIIVINYVQDSFDEEGNSYQLNKSVKIKVFKNANGSLEDKIEILD